MKVLQKAQFRIFVLLTALFLLCACLFTSAPVTRASASDASTSTDVECIDTNVENIVYAQHTSCVFFGFKLTESDYDDFGLFEEDFGGTSVYEAYENYIRFKLTYWENFEQMNSEGVILDQLYAYWNGSSVGPAKFANTVAHRSTLKLLEYGFTITIPAGTTFPSLTYVKGDCEGKVIMYKTTEDRAFYFNGTGFEIMPYSVAQTRTAAKEEIQSVNTKLYYEAECQQINELIEWAKGELEVSFSNLAVQDVLSSFYAKLDKIMTKADYRALSDRKTQAKAELTQIFEQLSQDNYESQDWAAIVAIQSESMALIDTLGSVDEVNAAIVGVQFSVDNVMNKTQRAAFEEYVDAAAKAIEDAFNPSLYRETERAQGAGLVEAGKQAILQATTYDGADAIKLETIASIGQLKTDAQWQEEENRQNNSDTTPPVDSGTADTSADESGCGSSVNALYTVFAATVLVAMIINKKKEGLER